MSELSIILRTSEYRGDHSADVSIAYELQPGETIETLAQRLLKLDVDWIEIRLVAPNKENSHA